MTARPYELFQVEPCTPIIGARVTGAELSRPSSKLLAELHRALLEWKVLFFEDQELSTELQLNLARCWGELQPIPFYPQSDGVTRLVKDAQTTGSENIWHTDMSFLDQIPFGSVLRAVEVPSVGGDTIWVDMGAAYDNLAADIREQVDDAWAVHDWERAWGPVVAPAEAETLRKLWPPVQHPVVMVHPETGRRTLFVNEPYTECIVDVELEQSSALLAILVAQATVPEYQVRFRWRPGCIAFWDNRAVQHYAVSDYHPSRRVMERATIAGPGSRAWETTS